MVKDLKYDPWSLHTRTYKMKCLLKNTFPLYIFKWRHNQDNQKFFKQLVMLQIYTYFVGISSLHQKPIIIQREHFEENMNTKGRFQKKKSMEFSILSKTHPPHSPSMEKKIKITWSKNHFYAKISILAKNYFFLKKGRKNARRLPTSALHEVHRAMAILN